MAADIPLELCPSLGLFLVPQTKLLIDVILPEIKTIGVSISNWDMMEKLRIGAKPEEFLNLRVHQGTRERITFKGELESLRALRKVILLLNGKTMRVPGYFGAFKVKAYTADVYFPTKIEWEVYFKGRGVDSFEEGRPGERADTVLISNAPRKWFLLRDEEIEEESVSTDLISSVFSKFGTVRNISTYQENGGMKHEDDSNSAFRSFGPVPSSSERAMEIYVQFSDYVGFCNAMMGLKGMKMMRKSDQSQEVADIDVTFDKYVWNFIKCFTSCIRNCMTTFKHLKVGNNWSICTCIT